MALNLLDALFRSLNSIKSGNEVCRRVSPLTLAHPFSHSSHLSFPLAALLLPLLPLHPSSSLAVFPLNYRTYLAKLPSAFQFALRVPSIIEFSARFFAFCAHENKVIPCVRDNIPFFIEKDRNRRDSRSKHAISEIAVDARKSFPRLDRNREAIFFFFARHRGLEMPLKLYFAPDSSLSVCFVLKKLAGQYLSCKCGARVQWTLKRSLYARSFLEVIIFSSSR